MYKKLIYIVIINFLIFMERIKIIEAISCYDCRSEDISCNVGECMGATCVKMETSNEYNERKTVSKACSNDYEDNHCKQTYLGPKIVLRCTCDSNFCNGDKNLAAAGLQQSAIDGNEENKFYSKILLISCIIVTNIFCFWI
ncbi:hypothetical protein Mgra_00007463 [Meloidogyne graminicola]|uniref:Activin_recp domain-containing protein n=1 Tax=Meloidogyne graminicola TaxID=189291 RepID=A0A8S9ZDI1_9BILA|nr:hypothetical protein Mgra_00009239 [Meloidogyne graminicola]KAF7633186.1 hypothetical protein Mgra_00007463 [Meloidogyne graminicola]